MRTLLLVTALAVAALAPGCACDSVPADALERCEASQVVPAEVQTDILFVIDDSRSMEEEQGNLSANLGAFVDALVASPIANHFRIGVTTTAAENFNATATAGQSYPANGPAPNVPYPDGALVAIRQDAGGAGTPGALVYDAVAHAATGGWGGARILDRGAPDLVRDFRANVLVGLSGPGKEQPFRAARLALSDRLGDANAGFLRPGARLAVVFVTDEDDCSDAADPRAGSNAACHDDVVKQAHPPVLDPVDDFARFLLGPIDGELREVTLGVIAGFDAATLTPSCGDAAICENTACGTAFDGADRFAALAAAVGGARVRLGSICDASFRQTLEDLAATVMPTTMPLEGAPADPGLLVVSVRRADGSAQACRVAEEGTTGQGAADAVYAAPRFGRPAMLTFQNACSLRLGDRIEVRIVCAG